MNLGNELDKRWARNFDAGQKRLALKERAVAYLGGQCRICGYNRSSVGFDFHHLDPSQKDFNISARTSWKAIVSELEKCVLLCACCHREVHAGLHPQFLSLDDEVRSDYGDFDDRG